MFLPLCGLGLLTRDREKNPKGTLQTNVLFTRKTCGARETLVSGDFEMCLNYIMKRHKVLQQKTQNKTNKKSERAPCEYKSTLFPDNKKKLSPNTYPLLLVYRVAHLS